MDNTCAFFKIFSTLFLAILFTSCLCHAQNKAISDREQWINFNWEPITLGERVFEKAAMQVPFTIDSISSPMTLQLDLGATSSMLYGNSIDYFIRSNPGLAAKLDTVHKNYMIEGQRQGGFHNLRTKIDGHHFAFNDMAYFEGYGDTITGAPAKPAAIGTLGAPFFAGKVLVIDYPNHRFAVLDSLADAARAQFEFLDCRLENSRIKIPFTIGGVVYWLMFDTGSSLFSIMTNQKYYEQFTGNSPVDSLGIPSWGKTLEVYGRKADKQLHFGSVVLPPNYVYMMPGNDWDDFYKSEGIIGVTGNALFLEKIIAIDFKSKKFGVCKFGSIKQ